MRRVKMSGSILATFKQALAVSGKGMLALFIFMFFFFVLLMLVDRIFPGKDIENQAGENP